MTFLSHVRISLGQMVQRTIGLLSLVQKVQVRRVQTLLVQALLDLQILCEHASHFQIEFKMQFLPLPRPLPRPRPRPRPASSSPW